LATAILARRSWERNFFQDNILFVEGQEDLGLLREHFQDTNVNIFGYGVRGLRQFVNFLELSKSLGLQKVSVLLDSGEDSIKIKKDLEDKFGDNFNVIISDHEDIRDKEAKTGKPKTGYFCSDGELKPEEKDKFFNLIRQINSHFQE